MEFGKNIKKLRRDRDMTQEELADALGVTTQAVSRWETSATMPDLSLFPAICYLFDVTSDFLLGVDIGKKEAKIKEIGDRAHRYRSRGYYDEARAILNEGLKEFPRTYSLMCDLAYVEINEGHYAGCIALCEEILAGCTDSMTRHSATQLLCISYPRVGEEEKALELAQSMPGMAISREMLMEFIGSGTKGYEYQQLAMNTMFQFMSNNMRKMNTKLDSGEWAYTEDEVALLWEKAIRFAELIYEDHNYGFYNCHVKEAHMNLARYFAGKQDGEQTLYHLEKAAESVVGFLNFASDKEFKYTCLLFRGMDKGVFSTSDQDNDAKAMLRDMEEEKFNFVWDDERFRQIAERLSERADVWTVGE